MLYKPPHDVGNRPGERISQGIMQGLQGMHATHQAPGNKRRKAEILVGGIHSSYQQNWQESGETQYHDANLGLENSPSNEHGKVHLSVCCLCVTWCQAWGRYVATADKMKEQMTECCSQGPHVP